ncbi:MAG: SRPBCC family protein [Planctomycetota bacterium]
MRIVNTVEINATPAEVFYWLEEPDRAKQWATSVTRSEFIEKTPNKVGTTFREYVEEDGRGIEMHGVVTEFETNRLFAVHLESELHSADVRFALAEEGTMTKLTQNVELHFKSVLSDAVCDSIKKTVMAQAQGEFARLKGLCEQDGQ